MLDRIKALFGRKKKEELKPIERKRFAQAGIPAPRASQGGWDFPDVEVEPLPIRPARSTHAPRGHEELRHIETPPMPVPVSDTNWQHHSTPSRSYDAPSHSHSSRDDSCSSSSSHSSSSYDSGSSYSSSCDSSSSSDSGSSSSCDSGGGGGGCD